MAARLQAAGVRPISAIVDITNYVLMELGHPMHAFDLARLAGPEIRVRRAKPGETITTLDGVERKLEADMLVIADATAAQAIAGVMGGADVRGVRRDPDGRLRERVLQAGVGAAHQQAPGPEDGSLCAIRTRRGHQRAGRRAGARSRR